MVEFVISKSGDISVDSTKVLSGLGFGLDEEVIELINGLPKWKPGFVTKWNKPAPVRMRIPITYKLPEMTSEVWSTFYVKQALNHLKNNQHKLAMTSINTALSNNNKFGNNYYVRALIHQAENNTKWACKDLKKAVKLGYNQEIFEGSEINCD